MLGQNVKTKKQQPKPYNESNFTITINVYNYNSDVISVVNDRFLFLRTNHGLLNIARLII